jgi:DNA modification methylase
MEIIFRPIDELKPFSKNPYIHPEKQLKYLIKSMREFGFTSPILISQDNMIIAGHARLQAAKEIGLAEVPTIFIDLPYERAVAYVIADNQLGKIAEQDDILMKELLDEISTIPDFDIEAVGFSDEDIKNLVQTEPAEIIEDNFDPDKEVETRCKEGDLWQLGRHRLLCGDSTIKENVERLMTGNQADMVFTDPPYSVNYTEKAKNVLKSSNYVEIKNDNLSVEETARSIWFPSFTNMFNYSTDACSFYCTMPQGGDQMMMMMMMMEAGWQVKHELIWVKEAPVFSMGRLDYDYKHEPIVYGWKKKHVFYGKGDFTKSVWEIPRIENKLHPTMKPVALISNAVLNSTKEGDCVLDIFSGSGSTLIACEQLNRTCYAMELDPHYCDVILSRWEKFTGQTAKRLD